MRCPKATSRHLFSSHEPNRESRRDCNGVERDDASLHSRQTPASVRAGYSESVSDVPIAAVFVLVGRWDGASSACGSPLPQPEASTLLLLSTDCF
jgi:hypothetical protein